MLVRVAQRPSETDEIKAAAYVKMYSNPILKDTDGDGIADGIDPEKMCYNITDRTLALVAGLSYSNLSNYIGQPIGELIDSGVIFGLRGTEPKKDLVNDALADIALGIGPTSPQSYIAYAEYKAIATNKNRHHFIAGHSLGGRLTQDVVYKVHNANEGFLGVFGKGGLKSLSIQLHLMDKVHSITLWHHDSNLNYPRINIID